MPTTTRPAASIATRIAAAASVWYLRAHLPSRITGETGRAETGRVAGRAGRRSRRRRWPGRPRRELGRGQPVRVTNKQVSRFPWPSSWARPKSASLSTLGPPGPFGSTIAGTCHHRTRWRECMGIEPTGNMSPCPPLVLKTRAGTSRTRTPTVALVHHATMAWISEGRRLPRMGEPD